MPNSTHLDFETFSKCDITKEGGYRYAMDSSTEVLMASYSGRTGPVSQWVPAKGEPMPFDLLEIFNDPNVIIKAFNAQFERLILKHVLKIDIPIERFRCVMVHAWSLSFSGGMAQVGAQLGLSSDKAKLATGGKLIRRFCMPAPSNHKADRYTLETHPDEWREFEEYNIQDTVTEREIDHLLKGYPMPQRELDLWFMDQRINDRGVPIDMALVNGACKIEVAEKTHLRKKLNQFTSLENGASNAQLKPWLESQGLVLDNMQAETMEKALKEGVPDHLIPVLEMKLKVSKTSTKKWAAFKKATGDDGRLRGMFSFYGAQRTGRYSGRIVQLQNLKRPSMKNPDELADMLVPGDRSLVECLHGDVIGLLSETVRCAITAPEGQRLVVSDLSSIESRILGWVANCTRINMLFAEGRDTYIDFAMELFQFPYDQVTGEQRTYSKPPTLGCGYQLGAKGLVDYADGMGVTMNGKEAKKAVDLWRELYPEVPEMWSWLIESCKTITNEAPGLVLVGYAVTIYRDMNFLFIDLPSGRRLAYYKPLVQMMTPPWEKEKTKEALEELLYEYELGIMDYEEYENMVLEVRAKERQIPTLTYMGMNQYVHKWSRISTHGGKITENIVQAIARDVLAYHMQIVENDGLDIVGHVHDEIIITIDDDLAETFLMEMENVMSLTPEWAPGLLLGASGFLTKRYKKD